jgi:hypothetical protein
MGSCKSRPSSASLFSHTHSLTLSQRTFPPLNIALYNAFGGTGDELYGIEPASYYLMNLTLMLGPITFPLAALGSVLILLAYLFPRLTGGIAVPYRLLVFLSPAMVWLAIMFSRPHKVSPFPQLTLAMASSSHHRS